VCASSAKQHQLYIWEKSVGNLVKILQGMRGEQLLDVVVSRILFCFDFSSISSTLPEVKIILEVHVHVSVTWKNFSCDMNRIFIAKPPVDPRIEQKMFLSFALRQNVYFRFVYHSRLRALPVWRCVAWQINLSPKSSKLSPFSTKFFSF